LALIAVRAVVEVEVLDVGIDGGPTVFTEAIAGADLIVVLHIHGVGQSALLGVGEAGDRACLLSCLRKDREENGCQNRNNGDDDKQFDQGESRVLSRHNSSPLLGYSPPLWQGNINCTLRHS